MSINKKKLGELIKDIETSLKIVEEKHNIKLIVESPRYSNEEVSVKVVGKKNI